MSPFKALAKAAGAYIAKKLLRSNSAQDVSQGTPVRTDLSNAFEDVAKDPTSHLPSLQGLSKPIMSVSNGGNILTVTWKCALSNPGKKSYGSNDGLGRRSKKVNCQYTLVGTISRDDPSFMFIEEVHGHTGHTPGDRKYLALHSDLEEKIRELLKGNLQPNAVLLALEKLFDFNTIASDGSINRRTTPTLKDVQRIAKSIAANARIHPNDVKGTLELIELLQEHLPGTVVDYQPQVKDVDGNITQHLRVILTSPFLTRMAQAFGKEMAFMDATYGFVSYGYPILVLLVRDEYCNGVPVAICISDNEDSEAFAHFLQKVAENAGFEWASLMIDKSEAEMAACGALQIRYYLCKFHMLQAIERFLKSHKSGMHGDKHKSTRSFTFVALRELIASSFRGEYEDKLKTFLTTTLKDFPKVRKYFEEEWVPCADHWARWGRQDVWHLESDTNNLLEAFNRLLKYVFARRRRHRRLDDLIRLIVFDVFPHFLQERINKVCGIVSTKAEELDERREREVQWLLDDKDGDRLMIRLLETCEAIAASTNQTIQGVGYNLSGGDLSCECKRNRLLNYICKHLVALCRKVPLTREVLEACAAKLAQLASENENYFAPLENALPEERLYSCPKLGDDRFDYLIDLLTISCTCGVFNLAGICPHLLAATLIDRLKFSKDLLEMDIPDVIDVPLPKRMLVVSEDFVEPLGDLMSAQNELESVKAVEVRLDKTSARVPSDVREAMNKCNVIKRNLNGLSSSQVSEISNALSALVDKVKGWLPFFANTTTEESKRNNRKNRENGYIFKALNPNRKRKVADKPIHSDEVAPTDEVEDGGDGESTNDDEDETIADRMARLGFARVVPPGRPRTATRGCEHLNRSSRGGGIVDKSREDGNL